jgi:hypothetical protein
MTTHANKFIVLSVLIIVVLAMTRCGGVKAQQVGYSRFTANSNSNLHQSSFQTQDVAVLKDSWTKKCYAIYTFIGPNRAFAAPLGEVPCVNP